MNPRPRSALGSVEVEVRLLLASASYAAAHPTVAQHLEEAFALLATGKVEHEIVSELGDHLRNAILDAINDVLGPAPRGEERPIMRLRDHVATLGLATREGKVLIAVVDLARVALRQDHRLSTITEELQFGEPDVVADELRRAAFATAFACYELDRLQGR